MFAITRRNWGYFFTDPTFRNRLEKAGGRLACAQRDAAANARRFQGKVPRATVASGRKPMIVTEPDECAPSTLAKTGVPTSNNLTIVTPTQALVGGIDLGAFCRDLTLTSPNPIGQG
jgi:hypothetical protein